MLVLLIGFGYKLENLVLLFMGGVVSILMGFAFYFQGFPGFDSVTMNLLAIVFIGLGFYFLIMPSVKMLENGFGWE